MLATTSPTGKKSIFNARMKTSASKYGNIALGYAGRLGNQKYLTAIRDAFSLLIPLVIAGGFAVLMRTLVFGGAGSTQFSILGWIGYATGDTFDKNAGMIGKSVDWGLRDNSTLWHISNVGNFAFYAVNSAVFDYLSLWVAFTLGYLIGNMRNSTTPILNGFVAVVAFMATTIAKSSLFGASGLLTAIIVAILSAEAFSWLSKSKKLLITMPAGVPPAVARAFARLLPAIIVLFAMVLVNLPFQLFGYISGTVSQPGNNLAQFGLADAIFVGVQAPFIRFATDNSGGLGIALIYVVAVMILWFFGLHGTNILNGIFSPLYLTLLTNNVNGGNAIFTTATFDAFIWFGGAGVTLALVISLMVFARKGSPDRAVSFLAFGPSIFNINEPMIFGLPLVLNIKWVVPFILAPVLLTISTYLGFLWGDIKPTTVLIPWVTPVGIGGYLSTGDYKGLILALINLALAFGIYLPFVFVWTRKQMKNDPMAMNPVVEPVAPVEEEVKTVSETATTTTAKRGRPAKVGGSK